MDIVTILVATVVALNVLLTGAIFYLRYLSNRELFKTPGNLQPVATKNRFFRLFNGLYDALDRVPVLRRSGQANEFDLFKAMTLVSAPLLLLQLALHQPPLYIGLLAVGIYLTVLNAILLAHPMTSRLVAGKRKG